MLALTLLLASSFNQIPHSDEGAAIVGDGKLNSFMSSHRTSLTNRMIAHQVQGTMNADSADEIEEMGRIATVSRLAQNEVFYRNSSYPVENLKGKIGQFQADAAEKDADGSFKNPYYEGITDWNADSAVAGGAILARQLEALWGRALEQVSPELQGTRIFPQKSRWGGQETGGGYENVRIDRFLERGQAKVWAGGNQGVPKSEIKQVSFHVPFRYLVSSAEWSFFDQLSFDRAQVDGVARLLKTATKAVEQLHDQIIWFGSSAHGLYGVLNYPWLSTRMVATAFSSSADKDAMVREITSLFTTVSEVSNGAFLPTDFAIASKLYNFLSTTVYATTSGKTLMMVIQDGLDAVVGGLMPGKKVTMRSVPRLNDAGGIGVHGAFAYENNEDAIAVIVSNPTSMLPLRQIDAQLSQVVWKAVAGVVMPNVGANYLGYVALS